MKLTKLSLVTALVVSAAVAGGDIEPAPVVAEEVSPWTFGGDAKLFYSTTDGVGVDLFDQAGSIGQAAVSADVSYAFADTWKVNVGLTGLATLGLDDHIVSGVFLYAGADASDGALPFTSVGDALWFDTANITGTAFDGKATFIIGRTELDTPFAFTETWNIANNTFDAAVAMVKPVDSLTLVARYIYDGNGNAQRVSTMGGGFTNDDGYFPITNAYGEEVSEGAWTVAGIYKWEELTAQAWYYDVIDVAQAIWVQGDYGYEGFTIGGQYAYIDPSDLGFDNFESSAFAGKIGYKYKAFEAWAAYSSVDDDGLVSISNTATMVGGAGWGGASGYPSGQSKLYTEAWWNYGFVGLPGADTFALAASYNYGDLSMFNGLNFLVQYTSEKDAQNTLVAALDPYDPATGDGTPLATWDMDEFTVVAGAKVYGLDVSLAYIWSDFTTNSADADYSAANTFDNNTVQAYFTYSF
jgi:hypothetical protein